MPECDGFFDNNNIPFDESAEDLAVHTVWVQWYSDPHYAKFLILCWYDVTFGRMRNGLWDNGPSRERMSKFLARTPYPNFEQLFADRGAFNNGETADLYRTR